MRELHPAQVLYDGDAPPRLLPACDHYAGSEKLMRRSLALQQRLGPVFDVTLDCEDGAEVGHEAAHAEMAASLLGSSDDAHGRVGLRIHDYRHSAWRDDVRIVLQHARRAPAYITLPKVHSVAETEEMCAYIEAARCHAGIARAIPIHALIETHGALADAAAIAALPPVEALSFGLMDFVSAHHGAIPDSAMCSPGQFEHPLVMRAKLAIAAACHAHGKVPSHNVSTALRDPAAVAGDARRAREQFGFTRMWSIHPDQIEPIVAAFAPHDDDIVLAADILDAAMRAGWGPIRHRDRLHDRASYRYYWSILRRARQGGRPLPAHALEFFAGRGQPADSHPSGSEAP
ncbi:MAG: HpcH/HpaI aldolase/citrate lyase family protein [Janthinobacterium lividum]